MTADRTRADGIRTRHALMEAAVALVAERGMGAVTHREVTERAGVSLTSGAHHFDTIDKLVESALAEFSTTYVEQLDLMASALGQPALTLEEFADGIIAIASVDPRLRVAQYETYLHATRSAAVLELTDATIRAFERVTTAGLRSAGVAEPERYARWFVSLIDGYQLQALARADGLDAESLRAALSALFDACPRRNP